jgi:Flp pilus assembly protein TadD
MSSGEIERGTYVWVYYRRGEAHANKRDFARAISDYAQTIRLDPGNAKALNDRGFVFASKGDFEVAIRDYGQANST